MRMKEPALPKRNTLFSFIGQFTCKLTTLQWPLQGTAVTVTSPNGHQIAAGNAARVDRSRCVVFHAPTLATGSFSNLVRRVAVLWR